MTGDDGGDSSAAGRSSCAPCSWPGVPAGTSVWEKACGPGPRPGTRYGPVRSRATGTRPSPCFCATDAVPLAAGSLPVPDLKIGEPSHVRVGGEDHGVRYPRLRNAAECLHESVLGA